MRRQFAWAAVTTGAFAVFALLVREAHGADGVLEPPLASLSASPPSGSHLTGVTSQALIAKPLESLLRDKGEPMIIGGVEADAASYPASYQLVSDGRICTWFLVGSQ